MRRGASGEAPCRGPAQLLYVLLRDYWLYFTKAEVLNSDGRRLLARSVRMVRRECRRAGRLAAEAIRDPTLSKVLRLLEELDPELAADARRLLESWMYGPRAWRAREWTSDL